MLYKIFFSLSQTHKNMKQFQFRKLDELKGLVLALLKKTTEVIKQRQ